MLVDKGPCKYVRHSSYTGAFVAILGLSLLAHPILSIVVSIITFVAYYFRIKNEEKH
ncbi:methyltransferase family protein [Acidianus brierleyi]|uniref:methyltransferase family protein n=1 Tax=Acidianus brierleyi TaxID=41673 RepID=UPI002483D8D7|nr:isoprenylcysteine carboxylmethyltransferase family protein [Acidianus brierleyi]